MVGIEEILKDVGPEGPTPMQRYAIGHVVLADCITRMMELTGPDAGEWLLPRLAGHWAFHGANDLEHSVLVRAALATWAGSALHVLIKPEEREQYAAWRKANRLPGFAGDKLPKHILPSANTWYEVGFPAGKYPTLVPVRDIGVKTNLVKVKRIAILAVHEFSTDPFPPRTPSPEFLKTASVVAFIEDALGEIHTYAGKVQYGSGGALMWRCTSVTDIQAAIHGDGPTGPMSNLSQFTAGELAYLIGYHEQFDYEALQASLFPATETAPGEEYDDNIADA